MYVCILEVSGIISKGVCNFILANNNNCSRIAITNRFRYNCIAKCKKIADLRPEISDFCILRYNYSHLTALRVISSANLCTICTLLKSAYVVLSFSRRQLGACFVIHG